MNPIIGIVMKPFLECQLNNSLWKDFYVKQDFSDIISKYNVTCVGIIPQGIIFDRKNGNDIDLSIEEDLTDNIKQQLISQINLCDGLILQGGLSSHKYEIFIAEYAIKNNIPLLGICAGFNNIARAINLEVEFNEKLTAKHDVYDLNYKHPITVLNNGKIIQKELLNNTPCVNSIHSISILAENAYKNNQVIIEAISDDSEIIGTKFLTVEAFSVKNTRFCLAIKWHPELSPHDEINKLIFQKYIESIKHI